MADNKKYSIAVLLKVIDKFTKPMLEASTGFAKLGHHAKIAETNFKAMNDAGKSLSKLGRTLSIGVTAPLTAIGVLSAKSAMTFNESMAMIAASVPGNIDWVKRLRSEIQKTSVDLAIYPEKLAEGAQIFVNILGKEDDIAKRIHLVGEAMKATGEDVSGIIHFATETMTAYRDNSLDAMKKILNIMTMLKYRGVANIESLTDSMSRSVTMGKSLGISLEEIGAGIVQLTKISPGQPSRPGFGLATLLEALIRLERKGVNVRKALAEAGGFPNFLTKLWESLGKSEAAIGQLVGGSRALGYSLELINKSQTEYKTLIEFVRKNHDFLYKALDEQVDGINKAGFAWDKFKVMLYNARIELGQQVLPKLSKALNKVLHPITQAFIDSSDASKNFMVWMGGLASLVGPATYGMGKLLQVMSSLGILMMTFKTVGGIKGFLGMGAHMVPFLLLLGKLALIIGAIAAGTVVIVNNWNKIENFIKSIVGDYKELNNLQDKFLNKLVGKQQKGMELVLGAFKYPETYGFAMGEIVEMLKLVPKRYPPIKKHFPIGGIPNDISSRVSKSLSYWKDIMPDAHFQKLKKYHPSMLSGGFNLKDFFKDYSVDMLMAGPQLREMSGGITEFKDIVRGILERANLIEGQSSIEVTIKNETDKQASVTSKSSNNKMINIELENAIYNGSIWGSL